MELISSFHHQAHQQDRKAETLLNYGRFADAIACHKKAAGVSYI